MLKNEINVCLICDDNYILPTCVTMNSILKNKNENTHLNIYVLTSSLNSKSKSYLTLNEKADVSVKIIETELGELSEIHKKSAASYCVATSEALLKFRIPELIDVSKILYLDGDLIVRSDLSELYNTDISNCYAAVIPETSKLYSQNKYVLAHEHYFNSGVMLLNLDVLRENNVTPLLIETKKQSNDSSLMDQNIFNEVFEGKAKHLSIVWNCLFVNLLRASAKYKIEDINKKYGTDFKSLNDIADAAKIVHFASKDKPWKFYNVPLADEWYGYYISFIKENNLMGLELNRDASTLECENFEGYDPKVPEIIVSLTSFPKRIEYVHVPIEDMFAQSKKPAKVLLWLLDAQFPNKESDLPESLISLKSQGLEICWCSADGDLKPHKKYFYTMQKYPESIVITIDDDIHYENNIIERLYSSYRKFPDCVSCLRGWTIKMYDRSNFAPYVEWQKTMKIVGIPNYLTLATGVGGVLYPPSIMQPNTFNPAIIKETCVNTDDLWLKWLQIKNNVKTVLIDKSCPLNYVEGTQEVALWKNNVVYDNHNDVNWPKIIKGTESFGKSNRDIMNELYCEYLNFVEVKKLNRKLAGAKNSRSRLLYYFATGLKSLKKNGFKKTWQYTMNVLRRE